MPRPANTMRAVFTGQLPQGEEFQTGFWMQQSGAFNNLAQLQALADFIATTFAANSVGLRALTTTATLYDEVRLYWYPQPGPAPAALIAVADVSLAGMGGANGSLPLQAALVASLRTSRVGRRYRGRMYWPMNAGQLTDHQANQGVIDLVSDNMAAIFEAVNAYAELDVEAVVMTAVGSDTTRITGVDVDSRLDVQRRRAEDQQELRQASSPVAA